MSAPFRYWFLILQLMIVGHASAAGFGNQSSDPTTPTSSFGNNTSTWHNIYGKGGFSTIEDLLASRSGGYLTAGAIGRNAALQWAGIADKQIQVAKVDTGGAYIWVKTFTPFGVEARGGVKRIVEDDVGNIIIAGNLGEYGTKNRKETRDVFVMKLNAAGEKIWSRKYGGPEANTVGSLAIANDGGILVLGDKGSGKDRQSWLFKLTEAGDFLGESLFPQQVTSNLIITDKHMLLSGRGLLIVDQAGNAVSFNDNFAGNLSHMMPHENGYLVGGNAVKGDRYPPWMGVVDKDGKLLWQRTYDFKGQKVAHFGSMAVDAEGIYSIGSQKKTFGDHAVAFIFKTDFEGNPVWKKLLTGTKRGSRFMEIVPTSDGGFLAAGATDEDFSMNTRPVKWFGKALLVKIDKAGSSDLLEDESLSRVKFWR
jgi:hypothetical protein